MRKGDNEREYRCQNIRAQEGACSQRGRETLDELPGWSPEQGVLRVTRMRQRGWDPGDP